MTRGVSSTCSLALFLISFVVISMLARPFLAVAGTNTAPPSWARLLDVLKDAHRVLWIGAHPDDETSAAALLARVKDTAGVLIMATMTRGENSDVVWNGIHRGTEMGQVREALFAKAAALLHADHYEVGPFVNGPRSIAELDALPANAAFRDWPPTATSDDVIEKWSREGDPVQYLVSVLRRQKPDVVMSMDEHCGVSGHDEHLATAKLIRRAIPLAAAKAAYPGSGEPWQVRHLIFPAQVLTPLVACRYCKCEGPPPPEPIQHVSTLDASAVHGMTYLDVQCLVARTYRNAVERKGWSDQQMRDGCRQIQTAAARAFRPGMTGAPFFEMFRVRVVD